MSTPSSQNPPALEQFFELLDKKFISWGAPGLLLGAGVHQFVAGAWLRASLCVIGAGGLWFLIMVGKLLAPKFKEFVIWTIAEAEAHLRRTWGLSKFEQQYIQQQAYHYEEDRIEGLERDRDRIPLVEEVFVPLDLSRSDAQLMPERLRSPDDSYQIWDLLTTSKSDRRFRTMSILAKGGMGKSTLLKRIAVLYGQGKQPRNAPKLIPVLLRLRTLIPILTQTRPPALPTLITEQYLPILGAPALKPPEKWAENLLVKGRSLVMLDGFDEVPEQHRPSVSQWIAQQIQNYPEAIFIVTSRPAGFKKQFYTALRPALTVHIKKFSPTQQAQFVSFHHQFSKKR